MSSSLSVSAFCDWHVYRTEDNNETDIRGIFPDPLAVLSSFKQDLLQPPARVV